MARLAWLTDLHLDHAPPEALEGLCREVEASGATHVLIGGDIGEAPSVVGYLEALGERLRRPIFFVLGNHDYYKGWISQVREQAAALSARSPWVRWLPAAGVVRLSAEVALVGHGGWGDGRAPELATSRVRLNDSVWIGDLAGRFGVELAAPLRRLGAEAASSLAPHLASALGWAREVIVLTHVPPFVGACWHMGATSDADWAPHFTCVSVGEVLLEAAQAHPGQRITALCGHTHSPGWYRAAPNLEVWTGEADYGEPEVQGVVELSEVGEAAWLPAGRVASMMPREA